jgi:hypothetical protein
MAWERLSHTALGSNAATISSGTITGKKSLRIIVYLKGDGSTAHDFNLQFNGDTGSNYSKRRSENGGSDSTNTSQDRMTLGSYNSNADDYYVIDIINKADQEKIAIINNTNAGTAGAGNAPNISEYAAKWSNTSAQITSIVALQQSGGSGSFIAGSYMTVLGAKEAATSDTITVSDLTAKKHLMIQYKGIRSGDIIAKLRFNNDSGNNYAQRLSDNGGSDGTNTSQSGLEIATSASNNEFSTIYVVNEAAKEKLVVAEIIGANTAGAGNAPRRRELSGKWANTSNAITRVDFVNTSTGDFAEGSEVTVYGTD